MKKLKKQDIWNTRIIPCLFAAGGIGIYLLLTVLIPETNRVSLEGRIMRDGYGGDEKEYQLLVEGLDSGMQEMTVTVSPRIYSDQEAKRVFRKIKNRLEHEICGTNSSLTEVREKLTLPTITEEGIRLRWISLDSEIISADGQIYPVYGKTQKTGLQVQLSDGIHKEVYEIPVCVAAAEQTEESGVLAGLSQVIQKRDLEQQEMEYLELPVLHEGKKLTYREQGNEDYRAFPVLGMLMAVLWIIRGQMQQRKKENQREKELLLDYPEIVSKLMVFIGAGMTVRNAWGQMVADYEKGLQKETFQVRPAYEEMRRISSQMVNGLPESAAYQEFGRRCRLQPYLKLSSLLEQNRKAGNKNLRMILETELTDAFELRKNLARRMGEEAGTKLLLPLFMMLGIVMVMIMVPAMMTMG